MKVGERNLRRGSCNLIGLSDGPFLFGASVIAAANDIKVSICDCFDEWPRRKCVEL